MESPFPAPGKTIKVKTFLPGAGNEVGLSAASALRLGAGAGAWPASQGCSLREAQSVAPSVLAVFVRNTG